MGYEPEMFTCHADSLHPLTCSICQVSIQNNSEGWCCLFSMLLVVDVDDFQRAGDCGVWALVLQIVHPDMASIQALLSQRPHSPGTVRMCSLPPLSSQMNIICLHTLLEHTCFHRLRCEIPSAVYRWCVSCASRPVPPLGNGARTCCMSMSNSLASYAVPWHTEPSCSVLFACMRSMF